MMTTSDSQLPIQFSTVLYSTTLPPLAPIHTSQICAVLGNHQTVPSCVSLLNFKLPHRLQRAWEKNSLMQSRFFGELYFVFTRAAPLPSSTFSKFCVSLDLAHINVTCTAGRLVSKKKNVTHKCGNLIAQVYRFLQTAVRLKKKKNGAKHKRYQLINKQKLSIKFFTSCTLKPYPF